MIDNWRAFQNILAPLSLLLFFCYLLDNNIKVYVKNTSTLLFYLFILWALSSALYNSSISMMFQILQLAVVYLALVLIFPSLYKRESNFLVINAIFLSHFPLVVIPLLVDGINSMPYTGIFYNPNSFGTVSATLLAVFLSIIIDNITSKRLKKIYFFIVIILSALSFVGIIYSASRTSFLTALLLVFITIFLYLVKLYNKGIIKLFKQSIYFLVSIMIISIVLFVPGTIRDVFVNNILDKNQRRSEGESGVFSNRDDMWITAIQEAGIFGNGYDYFYLNFGRGAHNTFIAILGVYGWVSIILFLLFLCTAFIFSFKYAIYSNDKFTFLPILLLTTFFALSLGEGMLMKLSMLGSFATYGVVVNYKYNSRY
ncbi:hypothetical protein KS419_17325 [Bacillus tamaricis]|uniref:Uncharacterized protein n=2 Tax=Evansella tamaricis TaxID=2069301 RepID=A0ABS6JII9_9BACI|nr:hypothetical protein [Evansella tamaricis]MBU9713492.1 hypothetical protein [Evansella tamaricis]